MSRNGVRSGVPIRLVHCLPRTRVTFHRASGRSLTRWCVKIPRVERPVSSCERAPHSVSVYPFHPAFLWPDTIFAHMCLHPLYLSLNLSTIIVNFVKERTNELSMPVSLRLFVADVFMNMRLNRISVISILLCRNLNSFCIYRF